MKKIAKKMHEEPTDPGVKAPDERDARIAALEAQISELKTVNEAPVFAGQQLAAQPLPPKALLDALKAHQTMSRRTGLRPHDHLLYRAAGLA
jgi:hypothetical protein